MAASQQISLGIGSPASIGWFLTLGLGGFAPVTLPSYGDPRELRSRNPSFSPKGMTFQSKAPSFTDKSPRGGRH